MSAPHPFANDVRVDAVMLAAFVAVMILVIVALVTTALTSPLLDLASATLHARSRRAPCLSSL